MDNRKFQAAAIATPPAVEASPSTGYPTDGDPNGGIPATVPGAAWFHQIGEELRAVLAAAAITPDDADLTQLLASIRTLDRTGSAATVASSATPAIFAAAGSVITYTGTATATGFDAAPAAGTTRTLLVQSYGASFTLGANLMMDGFASGYTYKCYPGMIVDVIAITTNSWRLAVRAYSAAWSAPTQYNTTNLSANTASQGRFTIAGNVCTFSLSLAQDPVTAGIATELQIAIGEGANSPPASAFNTASQCSGVGNNQVTNTAGVVLADAASDRLSFQTYPIANTNQSYSLTGSYNLL